MRGLGFSATHSLPPGAGESPLGCSSKSDGFEPQPYSLNTWSIHLPKTPFPSVKAEVLNSSVARCGPPCSGVDCSTRFHRLNDAADRLGESADLNPNPSYLTALLRCLGEASCPNSSIYPSRHAGQKGREPTSWPVSATPHPSLFLTGHFVPVHKEA